VIAPPADENSLLTRTVPVGAITGGAGLVAGPEIYDTRSGCRHRRTRLKLAGDPLEALSRTLEWMPRLSLEDLKLQFSAEQVLLPRVI